MFYFRLDQELNKAPCNIPGPHFVLGNPVRQMQRKPLLVNPTWQVPPFKHGFSATRILLKERSNIILSRQCLNINF